MTQQSYSFWDKIIYTIFSLPLGILIGLLICLLLSYYYEYFKGFGVYAGAALIGVGFTTILAFLLPSVSAKILSFLL